jgi:hypothetical protein
MIRIALFRWLARSFCERRGNEFLRSVHVGAIAIPPTHRAVDLMEAFCFRSRKAVKGAPFGAPPEAGFAP